MTKPTPTHLLPDSCYVCGGAAHPQPTPGKGHDYWSNADAAAEFKADAARLGDGPTWADGVFAEEKPFPEVAQ